MTQSSNTIAVFLTPEDSKLFVEFQQRYLFMKLMDSIGAFDLKNGSITIHFSKLGEIMSIDKDEHYQLP